MQGGRKDDLLRSLRRGVAPSETVWAEMFSRLNRGAYVDDFNDVRVASVCPHLQNHLPVPA